MVKEEYEKKKAEQKKIYLARVSSMLGDADFRKVMIEAEKKFEKEYPKYE